MWILVVEDRVEKYAAFCFTPLHIERGAGDIAYREVLGWSWVVSYWTGTITNRLKHVLCFVGRCHTPTHLQYVPTYANARTYTHMHQT